MNRRLTFAILILYATSMGIVTAQDQTGQKEMKELAGKAALLIEAGDLDGAVGELTVPARPRIALGASDLLIRHYYWQKKNLRVVVALSRNAIVRGREWAEAEADETARNQVLSQVKAIAYNLASFTWPGWGEEGIVIDEAVREEGVRAAELNLRLAKSLKRGPKALSAAHWIIGAHRLTAGKAEFAVMSFKRAKGHSEQAGDRAGALMNRGYVGIALAKSGQLAMGTGTVQSAISQLEAEGSDDAKFYAAQVQDIYLRLVAPDSTRNGLPTRIECGPVTLNVVISNTAIRFHIVDQLSGWSGPPNSRYRGPLKIDAEDEAALARFTKVRRRKVGGEFAKYFYTDDSLDDALFAAAEDGILNPAEVLVLSQVFARFDGARLREFRSEHADTLADFVESLKTRRLVGAVSAFAGFIGADPERIDVFPIPNPSPGVATYHPDGVVAVEVPREHDLTTSMIHAMAFELLTRKREELEKVAGKTSDLSVKTLTFSISFAFAEGLHHGKEGDPLAEMVGALRKGGKSVSPGGDSYTCQAFGLALRPILAEAMKKATFAEFLTMARISWKALLAREGKERGK